MKKTSVFLVLMAILLTVTPVLAAGRVPVGEQIRVGPPDGAIINFTAGEPFHIKHGWLGFLGGKGSEGVKKLASSGFDLEMDGVYLVRDYVLREVTFDYPIERCLTDGCLIKRSVFQFPEGLTGTHIFTGHWTIACEFQPVEEGEVVDCENPKEILEVQTRTITVIFE